MNLLMFLYLCRENISVMRTVILLGGSGYIGQHLMQEWLQSDKDVRFICVSRKGTPQDMLPELGKADIKWVKGDACDIKSFSDMLPERADAVIDLVGTASGRTQADFDRANAEPVKTMVEIMRRLEVPEGVYVSGVIGMPGSMRKFSSSKKKGERLAIESGLDIKIIRPSLVYGDRPGVGAMVAMMKFSGLFCRKMKPVTVDVLSRQIIDAIRK